MGLWNQTKPESLRYIDSLNEDWMVSVGYEGQYWPDRTPPALDPNEYPPTGITYVQAMDLVEYINSILLNTDGVALVTGAVQLWVNYQPGEGQASAYAPIQAFGGFTEADWSHLYEFHVLAGKVEGDGAALHQAVQLYDDFKVTPVNVIDRFARGELAINVQVTNYRPGWAALHATFTAAWAKALKSPNAL